MKQRHRHYGYLVLTIIIILFFGLNYFFPEVKNFSSPSFVRELLLGFGIWSYPIFIILLLLTIPLPIPSTPVVLGGGYIYGTILGSILALIAVIIGSTISFYLVRVYGRPLLERLVDQHHIEHFNHIFKKKGPLTAFISYVIPVFPSDCVSLILGLSKIKYRTFLMIVILGHIPRFLIINSLGEDLFIGITWKTILILLSATLLIVIAIFREKLKKFLFKELKELEHEAKITEKVLEKELKKDIKIIEKKAKIIRRKKK